MHEVKQTLFELLHMLLKQYKVKSSALGRCQYVPNPLKLEFAHT